MSFSESLVLIQQAGILTADDMIALDSKSVELVDTFQKVQIFRTRHEMVFSVLNDMKHPGVDAKYWQAVREQNVMFQELVMLSYEYRKNQIEIRKLERDLAEEADELESELLSIEIDKKRFIAMNQERTAKDRIREILEWSEIKAELAPLCEYSLDDVNAHQAVSLPQRFQNQLRSLGPNAGAADRLNIEGLNRTADRVRATGEIAPKREQRKLRSP